MTPGSAPVPDDVRDLLFELCTPDDVATIPTAVDHAYNMIWRQLMKGERTPGERLTDTELAAQLGLSRTPVRQALHRLAHEQLVRFDRRRGFSVRVFTPQDIHEIYDVRAALEALAVRLAAPLLSSGMVEGELQRVRTAKDTMRRDTDGDANVMHLLTDLKLHDMLIRASGNGLLLRSLTALRSQQILFQYWDTSFPERNELAAMEHERILLALAAKRTHDASELMAEHIANAKNRVLADVFGVDPSKFLGQRNGAEVNTQES